MRALLAILFIGLVLPSNAVHATTLETSLDRELALLNQEFQTLTKMRRDTELANAASLAAGQAKLEELTAALLELRDENQSLDQQAEPAFGAKLSNQGQLLERSVARLNKSIQSLPSDLAPITTDFERIPSVARTLIEQIYLQGKVRVEKNGSYFGENGASRNSDILWFSQVAAIALDSEGGPLLPTEADNFQLAPNLKKAVRIQAVSDGNSLVQSGSHRQLGVLLFDPDFPINNQFQTDKTFYETIEDGGLLIWPIIILALMGILICIERLWNLNQVHTNAEKLMFQVNQFIQKGQWAQADDYCEKNPGVVAKVMRVILKHRKLTREQMEDRANEVILTSRPVLERFLSGLNIVAVVSPLLGLLGTVTGMIGTFLVITQHGTGDPKLMAGGISEALLTTQYGLMVAIPALMSHSLLSRWVEHILGDIETNSLQLLNSIEQLSIIQLNPKVSQLNSQQISETKDA